MRLIQLLKSCLLCFQLLVSVEKLIAQQSSLIPPPPEAAAFFKSTDIPVSMYTGLPNIGIDFYSIKTKELQLPIRINYNARGIQVAEVASRVGLGWALQYGGMISRQVRGFGDEMGGILEHNFYDDVFTDGLSRSFLMDDIVNGEVDEVPDQFYYDINGESGKFIFDFHDRKILKQKFSDTKIEPMEDSDMGIVGWIVRDNKGNTYYFGRSKDSTRKACDYTKADISYSYDEQSGIKQLDVPVDRTCISAWHLMEIDTYLHEKIEFYYDMEWGVQFQKSYDKLIKDVSGTSFDKVYSFFSRNSDVQYQVKEIRFPGGSVVFDADTTERKDFVGSYALKKISLLDGNGSLVKVWNLFQHFDICQDDNNQLPYLKTVDTSAKYRLVLDSMKEFSSFGGYLPPYRFEYDAKKLPNRFSTSQDNWGYYNGKPNGKYLTFFTYYNAVNRTVDTLLSGAGLLNKITYPTGGATRFIYEQNKVMAAPIVSNLLISPNNPVDTAVVGVSMFRDSAYYKDSVYSRTFEIDTNKMGSIEFSFFLPVGVDTNSNTFVVYLRSLDGSLSYYLYPHTTVHQFDLDTGQYKLEVIPSFSHLHDSLAFLASLKWTIKIPNPDNLDSGEWYGAGKRIKRIEYLLGDSAVSYNDYEYLKADGTSSGNMFGLPNFFYVSRQYFGGMPIIDQWGCMPGSPLAALQGNSLGYERVTEYRGGKDKALGKTVYEFTVDPDAGDYYEFPYHVPTDFEWLRGLPTKTSTYAYQNGEYALQNEVINNYLYAGRYSSSSIFSQPFLAMDSVYKYYKDTTLFYLPLFTFAPTYDEYTQFIDIAHYSFKVYYLTGGTVDLASITEKDYSGGGELVNQKTYNYHYAHQYLPFLENTITSNNELSKVWTYYPRDLESRSAAEDSLIASNRVAVPVRIEDSLRSSSQELLATRLSLTHYKTWTNGLVLPDTLLSASNYARPEADMIFNKYDAFGYPLEITPRSGVKESYLWGYAGHWPVAQIIGSDFDTVAALVDTSLLNHADAYSENIIHAELNKIRTGLSSNKALINTYTYKPLLGMASFTNQNNWKVTYDYDPFGRLETVRDNDGYILKKYCYNYAGQQENCMLSTTAAWQPTGQSRCKPCPADSNYTIDVLQVEEMDMNPGSETYSQLRWRDTDSSGTCTISADWQNTTTALRCQTSSGNNTGYQEQEQKDMNPCSTTYNQTRWITAGYDSTACPLPVVCSTGNCNIQGPDYKCVNGTCERGTKVITDAYYSSAQGGNICVYHYEWSDGSWSSNYSQFTGIFLCSPF